MTNTIIELEQVNEFMRVMGQEMPDKPCIPDLKIQQLRYNLIDEENVELIDAVEDDNIVEVADALCDLLYVVLGAFTAYGFNPILAKELFSEVQRSNMSKICNSFDEATATVDKLVTQDEEANPNIYESDHEVRIKQYVIIPVDKYWVVNRVSDNKTQKSINYSKPDLATILRKHGIDVY